MQELAGATQVWPFGIRITPYGKGEYDLSEMYIVHQTYLDRADAAVRTHGDVSFSQGGSFYDVIYGMKNSVWCRKKKCARV